MLDKDLLQAIAEYTKKMSRRVELRLYAGAHDKRAELIDMLESVASASPMIRLPRRMTKGLQFGRA